MTPEELAAWLRTPRVLDGAMGSELLRRGVESADVLWGVGALLMAPERVRDVHRDHAAAGAEALTAATFRVAPHSLGRHGLGERAADLAKRAVACAREAVIASAAAVSTGLPVLVCFACLPGSKLLSGEDVATAATAVAGIPGVVAVGVNCTTVRETRPALLRMAEATALPLVAYANNAWHAADSSWLAAQETSPEHYARAALTWVAAGARLVGGCCGTTPPHIAAVAGALHREQQR